MELSHQKLVANGEERGKEPGNLCDQSVSKPGSCQPNSSSALKGVVFGSAKSYGCHDILTSFLGLSSACVLPITIPHGIDYYHLTLGGVDVHTYEPIYMAFRDDIADRIGKIKTVLKFPHPWLLIISEQKEKRGKGTLFIGPPPSRMHYETMLRAIMAGNYSKPWGVLVKERGIQREDFAWWKERQFLVHSAGHPQNSKFFYRLRDIFAAYEGVASPNMSSAVIFAVAMNRRAYAIPDVLIECIDSLDSEDQWDIDDADGRIANVWRNLLSDNLVRARSQAEELLGMKYMAEVGELRARLLQAVDSTSDRPIHLFACGDGLMYRIIVRLVEKGIPVHKLFPHPLSKITHRILALVGLNRLSVSSGSDFAHYGIAGSSGSLQFRSTFAFRLGKGAVAGNAIRSKTGSADPSHSCSNGQK